MRDSLSVVRAGLALVVFLVALASVVDAQPVVGSVSGGVASKAPPGDRTGAVFGGGADLRSGPLGLGGEVIFLHVPERTTTFTNQFGVVAGSASNPEINLTGLSFKASYYPVRFMNSRVRPFVDGGLSLFLPTDEDSAGSLDFGGGVDWWAWRRAGIRLDVRALLPMAIVVRCGVVFR